MNIEQVALERIIHDGAMFRWGKQNIKREQTDDILKGVKRLPLKEVRTVGELKTSKISSIEEIFKTDTLNKLPPIRIKKYKHTKYFEIIDGRHRVVLAIKYNKKTIDSLVESNDNIYNISNVSST